MNQNFPTDFSRAVNAEIRSWMGRRGLNQKQLAESAGISKSKISRILGTAEQSMDTDELDVICQVLEVSPAQVVDDAVRAVLAQQEQAEPQRPSGRYNSAGEWVPATRDGYTLAAYESDEEKGVDYIDD
ncbi:helix-turn-helix domain-containing protein [Rothia nasimurium]|uniref:helix-turn-helix domain-containing protein n=1 Tax=Rothia nasimurium TaxID=85336 RepID=UPI00361F38B2